MTHSHFVFGDHPFRDKYDYSKQCIRSEIQDVKLTARTTYWIQTTSAVISFMNVGIHDDGVRLPQELERVRKNRESQQNVQTPYGIWLLIVTEDSKGYGQTNKIRDLNRGCFQQRNS